MDEAAYRNAVALSNPVPCVFGRALLARCVGCELADRQALAEREVIACTRPTARLNCQTLAALFYERATFALRLPRPGTALPHATMLKLHCGGLLAMQKTLATPVADVHRMVVLCHEDGAGFGDLPWDELVAGMVRWQARHRSGGGGQRFFDKDRQV